MSELFVLQTPLPELILRAAVIYFFLLLVMRVIGRHEFGQLTPFYLILLLIISESISEALTAGDESLLAGLVSASTLLFLSVLVSVGQYKSRRIRSIVSPGALKVIENGRVIERSLKRELMTREDLVERLALFECSSSGSNEPSHSVQEVSMESRRCGSPTSRATATYRRSPTARAISTGPRLPPRRRRRRNDRRYPAVSNKRHENVGSVRFELTIDGSLRTCISAPTGHHLSIRRPIVHHVQRPLEPVAIPD
ncbi:hypothetical protein DIC75_10320 [Methanoculleus sp. CWC-02]|uniref:DUF421 domain-containing protein n=1 Tax=Methanoculleus oceani TaxID=2184756 RepID=A0ABD4TDA2_9EURY|nr:hypothetical protein [Methanoculleus sp. CWC-02]